MPPEPTSKPASIRLALAKLSAGADWGEVLSEIYDEGARQAVRRDHQPASWDDETPTISAQEKLRPSARPTKPPKPPPPLGSFADRKREPTQRTTVPPPPRKR